MASLYFYLLTHATVAGHKTLQRRRCNICTGRNTLQRHTLQHLHGQRANAATPTRAGGFADYELDHSLTQKILDIQKLNDEDRTSIIKTIDALLRDAKARKAYA